MSRIEELRALLNDAAGEAFLPSGWQRVIAAIEPALKEADEMRDHRLEAVIEYEAASEALYDLVTALGERFDADGTPCFCVTHDAINADGTVVHTPRCRMARVAIERHRAVR